MLKLLMTFGITDLASGTIKRMAGEVRNMGEAGKAAAADLDAAAEHFEKGAKAFAVGRELLMQIKGLVDEAATLESSLARLKVNLDKGSVEDMKAEMDAALALANEIQAATPFSAVDVLDDIVTPMKQAGLSMKDIMGGAAEASARLATAEGVDLEASNKAVMAYMAANKLGGADAAMAADEMVRYGSATATNAVELGDAFGSVRGLDSVKAERGYVAASLSAMSAKGVVGSEAGTAFSALIASIPELSKKSGGRIRTHNADGSNRDLEAIMADITTTFAGMTDKQRGKAMNEWFADTALPAVEAMTKQGTGSVADIRASAMGSQSLEERVTTQSDTLNAQVNAASGSIASLVASVFTPALDPLKDMMGTVNAGIAQAGEAVTTDPRIAQGVTGAVGVGGLGLAAYGLGRLGLAGRSGLKGLAGIGDAMPGGSLAKGLAMGKAVEEMGGAQSVFVVNWPEGFGGVGSAVSGAAAQAAEKPGMIRSALASLGTRLAPMALSAKALLGSSVASAGLGTTLGAAGVAGAAGVGIGTLADKHLIGQNTETEKVVQGLMALVMQTQRLWLSDEMTAEVDRTTMAGADALAKMLMSPFTIQNTINVDRSGGASVETGLVLARGGE